ncbi:MAG: hypothetical protein ACFFA6_10040 [Promethearchaeota archaeon]
MHEKQNRDSYPKIVKTKKKGIMEQKPPNEKIISYKLIDAEEKEESNFKRTKTD